MDSTAACTGYYPITGIQKGFGPDGKVPERMEIDEWWNSTKKVHENQVSLFIAALKVFQAMDYTCKLSYFQVAGIHSLPLVTWDEDQNPKPSTGYCEHKTNRFPTWHRPYLLLFEQRLYQIMVATVIPKFPVDQQNELEDAAQKWRLPFWDWASKKSVEDASTNNEPDYDVPQLIRLESVKIRGPEGWNWVKNPLYVFKMPKNVPMGDAGLNFSTFNACKGTSRYPPTNETLRPNSLSFIDGYQDNDSIMRVLRDHSIAPIDQADSKIARSGVNGGNLSSSLREAFYRIVVMGNYEAFSNTAYKRSNPREWDSIEGLHNTIHGWCGGAVINGIGGYGHMSRPEVAAFDPIFWLHHCNVDRLFAMWQAIHPKEENSDYWFKDSKDSRKELKPFRKDEAGTYWNSDDVYDTTKLGYTYSDLPKKRVSLDGTCSDLDHQQLDTLKTQINEVYGATRSCEQKAALTHVRPEILTPKDAFTDTLPAKIKAQVPKVDEQNRLGVYDYVVNVIFERFALGGRPFTVHILIGKVPERDTPDDGIEYKNVVGDVYNFVGSIGEGDSISGGCANCKAQAEKKSRSTGQIVLTNALVTRWKQRLLHENRHDGNYNDVLASMEPQDVSKFLRRNLHWRISDMNGKYVRKDKIPSLKVAVAVTKANHYADPKKLSEYGEYEVLYDITAGREGGANKEDHLFEEDPAA